MRFPAFLAAVVMSLSGGLSDLMQAASIRQFSPQGLVKGVRQVRAEFTDPMVPFGDPGTPVAPFEVSCEASGQGRWLDQLNWVYDFDKDLPSGLRCRFTLRSGLRALDQSAVTGPAEFEFSTGGPAIIRVVPWEGSQGVDENPVFLLFLDGSATRRSVLDNVYLAVEGLSSDVSVRFVEGEAREGILKSQWLGDFPREHILLVQPRQTLPSATRFRLVWGAGIAAPSGLATLQDQVFEFQTRPEFTAEFRCSRENADRDCIPLSPMHLRLSAPVPAAALAGARLTGPDGFVREPKLRGTQLIDSVSFEPPFPPETEFRLELPPDINDDADRRLANADRFPLRVRTDRYPPLAKFAASFGIIEAGEQAALPVTVRHLESPFALNSLRVEGPPVLAGTRFRVPSDSPQQILAWLQKLSTRYWDNRHISIFTDTLAAPDALTIPRPNPESSFEVLGIPLERTGFYVVEIQSRVLGEALLDPPQPMYVASSALVTNLSVHLKWGIENSLVWVTELASASPVSAADVQVWDCHGQLLWSGVTGEDGSVATDELPSPNQAPHCSWQTYGSGLLVTARSGDDLSFVHSSWNEGIEPWRFRLPQVYDDSLVSVHSILDRTLLRSGDTVHMKHILRRKTTAGLGVIPPGARPTTLVIRHIAGGDEYKLPVEWNEPGIAENEWTIPREAKLGAYEVSLRREGDSGGVEGPPDEFMDSGVSEWSSGSFRVEEFRVPLMRGALQGPAEPQVASNRIPLNATVEYLSGGPAKGLPVIVRYQIRPGFGGGFEAWEGFSFSGGAVREETVRTGEEPAAEAAELHRTAAVLDETGGTRLEIEVPEVPDRPLELTAELEFRDPNGAVQTVGTRVGLWPSGRVAGIKLDSWMMAQEQVGFEVAVANLQGRPQAGVPVEVDLFERRVISHRKRLVGGFYAYEHFRQITRQGSVCTGLSDERGTVRCDVTAPVSGNLILEVRVADDSGRWFRSSREFWVSGEDETWFQAEDHDRIDLLPEQPAYEPGQVARFQVRMPFRQATALVAVEREGVARHFVTRLNGNDPVIEVPLEIADAPNVFVSALVVRGRVSGTAPTAFVDLARPAYKLGIAEVKVGWTRNRLEVKVAPDRDVYRVRDRARVKFQVQSADRRQLPEPAELAVAVVDEGLLELWPNTSWSLLEAMMGRRGYGIANATAQMHVIGKRHFGLKALPQGGGGGAQSTRELFDTLLLWKGRVTLDRAGQGQVEFPLNDSVTSFRIVAVATAGTDRFGTGRASIRSTQELTLFSGIPPTAREGDKFQAEFTVRNSSTRKLTARLALKVQELGLNEVRTVQLTPGEGAVVSFPVEVAAGHSRLNYDLEAAAGSFTDRLRVSQEIAPAVPVRVLQATFSRLSDPFRLDLQLPEAAVPGRGAIQLDLRPSLLGGLDGARDYMAAYPYGCLEQVLSRAVTLGDRQQWDRWMNALPPYLDGEGLLRYFPQQRWGSDVLTAYVAALAHEAGWPIPESALSQMLDGLAGFAEGRVKRDYGLPTADLTLRRVAALEALSRYDRADPGLLSSITIAPALWPTSSVVDWYNLLRRLGQVDSRAGTVPETEQILRSRLSFQGTTAGFSTEASDRLSWLMISPDVNLARLILAFLEVGSTTDDLPRLVQGFVARQRHGRWDLTTANAWAALALRKFGERFEAEPVAGSTRFKLAGSAASLDWEGQPNGGRLELAWPPALDVLEADHTGTGAPWLWVRSSAALVGTAVDSGYRIIRMVEPVEQRSPGRWSVGDLMRVRLEIESQTDNAWVVVEDPIPSGASILGSGLRDSALATQEEEYRWGPRFEERTFRVFRGWWDLILKGRHSFEYTVRLNSAGEFQLPPTRVEALYDPDIFGELPNASLEVQP